MKEVFTELEFKTLAKDFWEMSLTLLLQHQQVVQTDLFGNAVQVQQATSKKIAEAIEEVEEEISEAVQKVDKNIHNSPHDYISYRR